jgi:hypothetical protein
MFGIRQRETSKASGRDALCEALLGEFVRGMVELGYASIKYDADDSILQTAFLAIGDPVLRTVTVGVGRSVSRGGGTVVVSIAAQASLHVSDPAVLAKLHRTALDHLESAPSQSGVKLMGHWNSIIAVVEMDLNPADYTFKGSIGVSLIRQMLEGVIKDLKAAINPYFRE